MNDYNSYFIIGVTSNNTRQKYYLSFIEKRAIKVENSVLRFMIINFFQIKATMPFLWICRTVLKGNWKGLAKENINLQKYILLDKTGFFSQMAHNPQFM